MTNQCKLFIGCVSRNTIDATIEYSNEYNTPIGLIPSRRQIDYDGGYIGFTSQQLNEYVHSRTNNIILQRDHGGPSQGKKIDDGIFSIIDDCKYYDLLHIDPWKQYSNIEEGMQKTKELIELCIANNYTGQFEIATEQSIREFDVEDIRYLIQNLKQYPLKYIVIQSGTSLRENENTGIYNQDKLKTFCKTVSEHNYLSKEHNSDYLSSFLIHEKFKYGLDAINIAPEFGLIETNCYLEIINDDKLLNSYYDICYNSNQWKKWVSKDFNVENKKKLIQICGHYVLNTDDFKNEIKNKLPNIDGDIKLRMKNRIKNILNYE